MNQPINLTLAFVVVALACGLALAILQPTFMRWLCGHGLAVASCVEAFKVNRVQEVEYWHKKLGVEDARALVAEEREA